MFFLLFVLQVLYHVHRVRVKMVALVFHHQKATHFASKLKKEKNENIFQNFIVSKYFIILIRKAIKLKADL